MAPRDGKTVAKERQIRAEIYYIIPEIHGRQVPMSEERMYQGRKKTRGGCKGNLTIPFESLDLCAMTGYRRHIVNRGPGENMSREGKKSQYVRRRWGKQYGTLQVLVERGGKETGVGAWERGGRVGVGRKKITVRAPASVEGTVPVWSGDA